MCYHSYVRHIIVCVAIHMSDILLCHMCVWPFHMSDMSEKWVLAEENCIPLTARVAFHWQWELHSTDNKHVKFDKVNNAQFAHYYQQNCCFQQSQHITLKTHTHTHTHTQKQQHFLASAASEQTSEFKTKWKYETEYYGCWQNLK